MHLGVALPACLPFSPTVLRSCRYNSFTASGIRAPLNWFLNGLVVLLLHLLRVFINACYRIILLKSVPSRLTRIFSGFPQWIIDIMWAITYKFAKRTKASFIGVYNRHYTYVRYNIIFYPQRFLNKTHHGVGIVIEMYD